jgi:hypothetical protein
MFGKIRAWWTNRQQQKREKWAEDRAWISAAEMDKVQRGFSGGRRRAGQTRRRPGQRY